MISFRGGRDDEEKMETLPGREMMKTTTRLGRKK